MTLYRTPGVKGLKAKKGVFLLSIILNDRFEHLFDFQLKKPFLADFGVLHFNNYQQRMLSEKLF